MRVIAIITFATAAMALANPAEARHRYHHHSQQASTPAQHAVLDCDNDGRCRVHSVTPTQARVLTTRRRHRGRVEAAVTLPPNQPTGLLPNGMVRVATAYGFYITVNPMDADKFLKFFALLKEKHYSVDPRIVGCYSATGHKPGSNHHIGRACDIQTGWNRGPAFVYHMKDIVRQAGLYNGCDFGDCGHVEAVRGLFNKRPNLYASVEKFKAYQSTASYQP